MAIYRYQGNKYNPQEQDTETAHLSTSSERPLTSSIGTQIWYWEQEIPDQNTDKLGKNQ